MKTIRSMALGIAVGALAGCTAPHSVTEDDDAVADYDGDGKADGIAIVKKRRSMTAVRCPPGETPTKVAFFDADSTIRVSKSGAVTANTATDVNVLPFAATEIKRLAEEGYLVAVVSNQGGVAQGHTTFTVAEKALALAISKLRAQGAPVHYFDFAEKNDHNRKPEPGMAERLDAKLTSKCGEGIDWDASFMVGDSGYKKNVDGPHPDGRPADDFSNSDRLFAEGLGIPFHEPTDFFHWRDYEVFNIASPDELVAFVEAIEVRAAALRAEAEAVAEDEAEDDDANAEARAALLAQAEALEVEAKSNRDLNDLHPE